MSSEVQHISRIGILGAGRAGTALARIAAASGIDVNIAASRPPAALKYHLMQYAPQATAVVASQIADGVDLVVLMVPQEELDGVDPGNLADVILVDATNRWEAEPIPTWLEASLAAGLSSSEAIAARFSSATLVKAFNHLSHWDLDAADRTSTTPPRALVIASDDAAAAQTVATLTEQLCFEPVIFNQLAAGKIAEPGSHIFNNPLSAEDLRPYTS